MGNHGVSQVILESFIEIWGLFGCLGQGFKEAPLSRVSYKLDAGRKVGQFYW